MKKVIIAITGFAALFISVCAQAQITPLKPRDEVIEPYRLFVTFYKTTNLVFPFSIKSVDRGSQDILAQKAKNVDNVLQLKAAKTSFDETNLTVITSDGKLYSYVLDYADTPTVLNVSFDDHSIWNRRAFFSEHGINEAEVEEEAKKVALSGKTVKRLRCKSEGISFHLDAIYVNGPVMYFRFRVFNRSDIDYDVSQFRMLLRDQKKIKRTATQELEINPLFSVNAGAKIAGKTETEIIYAVPKFTIPDKKYLSVQLMEQNGGRTMVLSVHDKTIVKAKLLR